jgi:hypothetical protein
MTELETEDERPFTATERREMRQMLEREKRVIWFWATTRVWAGWIAALVAAYFATKSVIIEVLTTK